jgi:hypothetical protein
MTVRRIQANICAEKLLDTLNGEDFNTFMELLQPAVTQAKRTGCGKQMLSIEKKLHNRVATVRWGANNNASNNFGNHGGYGLQLPTPPFVSQYGSAAPTPPPMIAETSLQSSNLPGVNGDAVEGADRASRKGSEALSDLNNYR